MVKRKRSKRNISKTKVRTIIKRVPQEDITPKLKSDIKSLGKKRDATKGKGFGGFLQRMNLTKQINDKNKYFSNRDKLRNIDQTTTLVRKQVELENAKAELKQARQKSQVNFSGFGSTSNQIKMEDIFK